MRRGTWVLLATSFVVGLTEPHAEVAFRCRQGFEASEACVWARAFLPLGQVVAPLFVTPVAFGVLVGMRWLAISAKRPREDRR